MSPYRLFICAIPILLCNTIKAQVTGRETNTTHRSVVRDTAMTGKKVIEAKYDSLINDCRGQIAILKTRITATESQIGFLKNQEKQLGLDYQNGLPNPPRTLASEDKRTQSQPNQNEFDKKMDALNKQISAANKSINDDKALIKQLNLKINQLNKEKKAATSKKTKEEPKTTTQNENDK